MGKSWRHIPGAYDDGGRPDYGRHSPQPEVITGDWAVRRLAKRVECWTEDMMAKGVFGSDIMDDVLAGFDRTIRHAVSYYDPDRRGCNGRPVAATTFLRAAFEYAAMNVVRYLNRKCRSAVRVPIVDTDVEQANKDGFVSSEAPVFSDGCRTMEALWLRMDLDALMRMLPARERTCLRMLCEGHTLEEVASELKTSRRTIQRSVVPVIRLSARLCGFFSHEDSAAGRNRECLYARGGPLRPMWAR